VVGYTGGSTPDPSYDSIGDHAEAIRVTFDPRRLPLDTLIRQFWKEHQPMPLSFTGTQYRSAIFCHGESQLSVAKHVRQSLVGRSPFSSPEELTALELAGDFYRAEDYHQRFLEKQRAGVFPFSPSI